MTIENLNKVDVVSVEDGSYVLTIVDHWDWVVKFDHLPQLEEKLNNYLAYVEAGELAVAFPDAVGKPVVIEIEFLFEPEGIAVEFLDVVKGTVEGAGFGFRWFVKELS